MLVVRNEEYDEHQGKCEVQRNISSSDHFSVGH